MRSVFCYHLAMNNEKVKVWLWLIVSCVVIGVMLFASAGTIDFWQAWVYLAVVGLSSIPITVLIANDPVLRASRTRFGVAAEARPYQKLIVAFLLIAVLAQFILPGLDHRFGWSNAPMWVCIAGNFLILVSMCLSYRVFQENSYGSAAVEISKDQKVISTGPYAVVRHPMYSSASLYFIGMSLALGSYWAIIPSMLIILGFVLRLFDEENFLVDDLPGYLEYCGRVRWHLVPGVF